MRKLICLLTLFVCGALASAQFEMPVTHPHFILLTQPKVKEHLKVTDEQNGKIKAVLDPIVHDSGDGRTFISINGSEDMDQIDKNAVKILDEKQQQRLQELWLQRTGFLALTVKAVAEKVTLTSGQTKKLDDIVSEFRQTMSDMFMTDDGGGSVEVKIDPTKMEALQKDTDKKIAALLTEEQNAIWKKMLGEKFDFGEKDK